MVGEHLALSAPDWRPCPGYLAKPEAGSGPALLVAADPGRPGEEARAWADLFAEEGYVAFAPSWEGTDWHTAPPRLATLIAALKARPECTGGIAALGVGRGCGPVLMAAADGSVQGAVLYVTGDPPPPAPGGAAPRCPLVAHCAEQGDAGAAVRVALGDSRAVTVYAYPGARRDFAAPPGQNRDASLAHSRSIALLRAAIGPRYDLVSLWERHLACEFETRDVAGTMATMVAEPYVNHVPTMMGGVGKRDLSRFYRDHFIFSNPPDTRSVLVSRTVGADRVVDEILHCFTHTTPVDWMLPGVAPTGRPVEIPLVAVVTFRGDKIWHEHIYWDQASVLVQVGLLDSRLYPAAGVETARKLTDETLPSNTMLTRARDDER